MALVHYLSGAENVTSATFYVHDLIETGFTMLSQRDNFMQIIIWIYFFFYGKRKCARMMQYVGNKKNPFVIMWFRACS